MIYLPPYCFIEGGWVQADSKLQVASLVFPLNKHNTVNPWGGFMYWLQHSHFQHLVNLFFKSFFQVHQDWSTRALPGCYTWIQHV